jgi:hypothetical protein
MSNPYPKVKIKNNIDFYKKNKRLISYVNFLSRWVFSTNHKDIGVLYFFFGAFSGILGIAFLILKNVEIFSTQKKFPTSGFLEVRYNKEKQKITYEPIQLNCLGRFLHNK